MPYFAIDRADLADMSALELVTLLSDAEAAPVGTDENHIICTGEFAPNATLWSSAGVTVRAVADNRDTTERFLLNLEPGTALPDDLPHVLHLRDAGIDTLEALADVDDLTDISGIWSARADEIEAALEETWCHATTSPAPTAARRAR